MINTLFDMSSMINILFDMSFMINITFLIMDQNF
jgi:hypothetical protein